MNRTVVSLFLPAVAAVALAGSTARAAAIHWSYQWQPVAQVVSSDFAIVPLKNGVPVVPINLPIGAITLSSGGGARVLGSTDLIAGSLRSYSLASDNLPAHFTNKKFSLTLSLTDLASHRTGSIQFNGEINGTLSRHSASIRGTFLGSLTKSVILGQNVYTVALGPFAPPGPPNASNLGSIGASVNVRSRISPHPQDQLSTVVGPPVSETPEPSTLVLAGLGISVAGLTWRVRRRAGRPVNR